MIMNVLFVCTGNTCRSPMAEWYLKSKNLKDISVKSAGVAAFGDRASEYSTQVMKEIGIDISSHISSPITSYHIDWADRIYCIGTSHYSALAPLITQKYKLRLLGHGIADPFGQDIEVYRACRDEIAEIIDKIFANVEIKDFEPLFAEDIAKIEEACFSSPWSSKAILESHQNGTSFFVAVKDNKCIGYCGIDTVLDEGYITNVAILPEFRKMGIADRLMCRLDELAIEKKLSFISLEVRQSNKDAIKLYTKNGYEAAGTRKDFYTSPKEDAVIMTKRF